MYKICHALLPTFRGLCPLWLGFLNPLSQLDISPFPIYPPVLFVADQQVISNNRSLFIPFLYISTMMCSQSIGRPSCYFSAWGAGSGQASSRCSALCTCKQACRRLNLLLLSHQVLTCGRFWLRLSCAPQHHSATCTSPCTCTCTPTCSNVFCRYFPCTQRVPSSVYMHLHLYLQVYFRYSSGYTCPCTCTGTRT